MQAGSELRKNLHGIWASVAAGWGEHADYADERATPITEKLLELSEPRPGDRVLELACGPGGLGLAAAERVLPDGEVVLSDVVEEMTAIAAGRAAERGLGNVATKVLDLEEIDQPDASYDVVLCREGLMFAVEPERAAREMQRVLRPAGRAAVAVWGPRDRNPWLGAVLDSVSAQLGVPIPPPGIPGPFALEDAERLSAILAGAGFAGATVSEVDVRLRAGSFDEWWDRTTTLAGPLARMLEAMDSGAAEELRARAQAAAEPYRTEAGLDFPGVTLVGFGRRA